MSSAKVLLVLLLGIGAVRSSCREAKLPRDCEALCSFGFDGEVTSCELRAAVLLPNDPRFDISYPKVMPVLGKHFEQGLFGSRI
jgi:hypothetical protein